MTKLEAAAQEYAKAAAWVRKCEAACEANERERDALATYASEAWQVKESAVEVARGARRKLLDLATELYKP